MKKILFVAAAVLAAVSLRAEADGYIMMSVYSPGELPGPSSVIHGGRLSLIYGECRELYGLDISVTGSVRERMYGAQLGLILNYVDVAAGYQRSFANFVEHEFYGLQDGAWNHAAEGYGAQHGIVNTAGYFSGHQSALAINWADEVYGFQSAGLWNHATDGFGMQHGFVNTADYFCGFQLGFFNWAEDLDGLQIGLVNVVANQAVPVLPFINIGF